MLKKILLALVVVVVGFLGFAATRPGTYRVERSLEMAAPPEVIYSQLEDFRLWSAWSPWDKLDPQMTKSFEGPAKGEGAAYTWQGNDKVGKGKMTITKSDVPRRISYRLEFFEPFAAVANSEFATSRMGAVTGVAWTMEGTNNFMSKVFGIFVNMDQAIGGDFETGLASLKQVSEAEAARQAKAAAEAVAAAQAAAAEAAQRAEVAAAAEAQRVAAEAASKKPARKR